MHEIRVDLIRSRPDSRCRRPSIDGESCSELAEKPDARWDDPEARRQVLNSLVEHGKEALARTVGLALSPEQAHARELLQTVVGQDTGSGRRGGVRIRQGMAKDRLCSVTDPEMRHGHQTRSGRFGGHKAEIGMDWAAELITHVEAKGGNSAAGEHLAEKMSETEQAVGVQIERRTGDAAYGQLAVREAMAERGTGVLAPVTAPQNRRLFTKDAFQIDLEARGCTCPAGEQGRMTFNKVGEWTGFRF